MKTLKNILISMRPEQWAKNLIIYAGLFFGRSLGSMEAIFLTTEVFIVFCLASSGSYIINDIIDRNEDRHHPRKTQRPVAAGTLDIKAALAASLLLIASALLWSAVLSPRLLPLVVVFLALHILYDFFLKHIPIVDVFIIAMGFILRLVAGVVLSPVDIKPSLWILLCTFLLALFLGLCKRLAELNMLMEDSGKHRKSLDGYSHKYLEQLIAISAGCTILSYALYALSPDTIAKHGTTKFIYTIPFVIYGIFRYLHIVYVHKGGGSPEKILMRDMPFLANMILYSISVYLVVYFR